MQNTQNDGNRALSLSRFRNFGPCYKDVSWAPHVIWMNAIYVVSLAKHLSVVADAFCPLRSHQCYWTTEQPYRCYMDKLNVWNVTSDPSQRRRRCVTSFKGSSLLLNNWEVNYTKVTLHALRSCIHIHTYTKFILMQKKLTQYL